jgi:hypothetical protein
MFLNLASRFSNFFAIDWKSVVITSFYMTVMDLAIAVTFCNCAISIVILAVTLWTIRVRRQIVGLTKFCDRCLDNWNLLSHSTPASLDRIEIGRRQFEQLIQIYHQQLVTLDRIRTLRTTFKVAKSLLRL